MGTSRGLPDRHGPLAEGTTAEDLRGLLAEWSATAAAPMQGEDPPKLAGESEEHFDAEAVSAGLDPARLTVTFGLGPTLFTNTGLDAAEPYDAGLLFASFQADREVFIETQEKMAASDRLTAFIIDEGSAGEDGFVTEGLFGS